MNQNQHNQLREDRKKDNRALFNIQFALDILNFPHIASMPKSKEAWEALQTTYQGSDKVRFIRLQTFRRDFENLRMREAESIQEYITRTQDIVNQLRSQGETIIEKKIVEKILKSLPLKFDLVVIAIEETKDLTTFQFAELVGSLQSHEARMKCSTESLAQAFQSTVRIEEKHLNPSSHSNKSQGESSSNRGHGRGRGRGRGYVDRRNIQCRYCDRYGHYEFECKKKKSNLKKSRDNYAEKSFEEAKHSTFFACNFAKEPQTDLWFLDNGYSNHMIDKSDIFCQVR